MKKCSKLPEPATFAGYRQAQPHATWEQMRDDAFHGGQQAYGDVKRTLVRGQRCLCAYCEISIATATTDAAIDLKKADQRVEHFHPKEDRAGPLNWALRWPNLWAVCHGGASRPPGGDPADPDRKAKGQLEKQISILQKQYPNASRQVAHDLLLHLARQLFPTDAATPWREFFTLIRARLGEAAEDRLRELRFDG